MAPAKHILIWLALIFILFIIVPTQLTPENARHRVVKEVNEVKQVFGDSQGDKLTERSNAVHKALFIDTGIQGLITARYTTEEQLREQSLGQHQQRAMGTLMNRYLYSFSTQVYGVVLRLNIFAQWLLYVGAFVLAALIDGVVRRRIKLASARSISSVRYALALHLVIIIIFLPAVYLVVPVYVTPWITPIWALVISFPLSYAVENFIGLD